MECAIELRNQNGNPTQVVEPKLCYNSRGSGWGWGGGYQNLKTNQYQMRKCWPYTRREKGGNKENKSMNPKLLLN